MLRLIWGEHTAEHAIEFAQSLDKTCATRWLSYFHPSVDLSKVAVAHLPLIKRAFDEKRLELFGGRPKSNAIVCGSEAVKIYFDFWARYSGGGERVFSSLDEAFDWLGMSETARTDVSRALERWVADAELGHLSVGRSQAGPPEPGARAEPDLPGQK